MTEAVHWPASARCQQAQDTTPMKHSEPGQTTPPHLLESVNTAEQCPPSSLTTLSTIDPSTSPPPHPDRRRRTRRWYWSCPASRACCTGLWR